MTLAQKAQWKRIEEELISTSKNRYQEYCGQPVDLSFDKESFGDRDLGYVSTFADMILEGVYNVCSKGSDEKDAVNGGFKKMKIGFGTPSFTKNGDTLMVVTDLGETNNASTVRNQLTDWLMNNL